MSGFGPGGDTFGSPFGSPFGNSMQRQQPPSFGTSSTSNSFDSRQQQFPQSGSFGSTPASFGGTSAGSGGMSFGASPHVTQFGTGTSTTQQSHGMFAPGATTTFGQTQMNANSPWNAQGGLSSSTTPFGASSNVSFAAPASLMPFGTASTSTPFSKSMATTTPFFNANQPQPHAPFGFSSMPSTPFGSSNAAATPSQQTFGNNNSIANHPVTFGVSSNVANFSSPSSTNPGHINSNYHQDDYDMSSSPIPYGQEREMGANHFEPNASSQATGQHFGLPDTVDRVWQRPHTDQQKESKPLNANAAVFTPFGGPQPQQQGHDDADGDQAASEETSEDKLAKLKAKIEEKKRRLLDKRKKEHSSNSNHESESRGATPPPQSTALAQRNALRFAQSLVPNTDEDEERRPAKLAATHSQHIANTTSSGIAATEREDLQNAVSLVGTCAYMCPEEELQRRQAENDIQLLELPRPGTLHPPDWTLRDTAVKRFRRSAADYKLDVPEWVRPPDVLERVMGYLEEWVMERDRQGGDARFPNGGVPPSLDVYQFIWDRTRMIRKDFILQNYVGTGGMCDARAVRCHERIARWHAMCEHQLSHIPDFVKAQSQQNISELGQTLKSLNQFYDDSLNRSMIEVANERGQELRTDLRQYNHGCDLDIVQGPDPVDYDGTSLINSAGDAAHQLIGKHAIHNLNHGTAEAEMRGLYIILTIDNDGGMEVLKYAARLYNERPEIYHSELVQLAMAVYKARREYNYARFFSILRSPKTPYLFACLMFKHVEVMRKLAFRIMSRTYGARTKDNEAIYDAYPLADLMDLLCFESPEEARKACEHFGITVKPSNVRTSTGSSVEDIVFWRQSSYKEPTDEEKGTVVPLPPWKMVKTIENKLHGATRLAVCRGQVSGDARQQGPGKVARVSAESTVQLSSGNNEEQNRKTGITSELRSEAHQLTIKETQEEVKMLAFERDRRDTEERARNEAKARMLAEEEARRRAEEEARRRAEEEERERAQKEAHAEAIRRDEERKATLEREAQMRRQAEEAARKVAEDEARRKAEEAAARAAEEKLRREAEDKARHEAEEERIRQELEAEARRKAEELARREEARRAKLAAAERQRILAAQQQAERDWQQKRTTAKRFLTLGRWLQTLPRNVLDDGFPDLQSTRLSIESLLVVPNPPKQDKRQQIGDTPEFQLRRSLEACAKSDKSISIAKLVCSETSTESWTDRPMTALFVVALLMPACNNDEQRALCDLVRIWILSRLQSDRCLDSGLDVRVALLNPGRSARSCAIDAVLALDLSWNRTTANALANNFEPHIPAVVLKLLPGESALPSNAVVVSSLDLEPESLEAALEESVHHIASQLRQTDPPLLDKIPLGTICYILGHSIVDAARSIERRDDLLGLVQLALHCAIDYLDEVAVSLAGGPAWPCGAFALGEGVKDYFGPGQDLPLDWLSSFRKASTAPFVADLSACLTGSVEDAIRTLLSDAPEFVQQQSRALLQRRQFRNALKLSFRWRQEHTEEAPYLYLPRGTLGAIVQETTARAQTRMDELYPPVMRRREPEPALALEWTGGVSDSRDDEAAEAGASVAPASDVGAAPLASPSASKRRRDTESAVEPWSPIDPAPSSKKTRRQGPEPPVSEEVRESRAFTRKLEAYLAGTDMKDMVVGTRPLSSYLRKAPKAILP